MAELYLVDGKVCQLIDTRLNFQGLKAIEVVLRFCEIEPVGEFGESVSPTIQTFTKLWRFPSPTTVTGNVVSPSTKLQALGELGIKTYVS